MSKFKKTGLLIFSIFLMFTMCGCAVLLAGAVGSAGTAVWLSGKLSQEFHASYEKAVDASKKALQSLQLDLTKETKDADVCQLRSIYTDGKEVWVDIRRITKDSTKVEVRVGAVKPDKQASDKILKAIQRHL